MQGIPPDVRPWAWMAISGAADCRAAHMANYFTAMVDKGQAASPCAHQIELVRCPSNEGIVMDTEGGGPWDWL